MKVSLFEVKRALKGLSVMSDELDKIATSFANNAVPDSWGKVGFLSMKPLGSWNEDLLERVKFLSDWVEGGTPNVFWMSGFFFP
mmetsp:Transcript_122852/g.183809  ORF Transcript_122852/g.183809 Transcript_122852/m.183809 type:complete len:84 (+) Transcript_122852:139-390(+)